MKYSIVCLSIAVIFVSLADYKTGQRVDHVRDRIEKLEWDTEGLARDVTKIGIGVRRLQGATDEEIERTVPGILERLKMEPVRETGLDKLEMEVRDLIERQERERAKRQEAPTGTAFVSYEEYHKTMKFLEEVQEQRILLELEAVARGYGDLVPTDGGEFVEFKWRGPLKARKTPIVPAPAESIEEQAEKYHREKQKDDGPPTVERTEQNPK